MIPVRSTRSASDLDFASIAVAELEILERGLSVVARSVPFRPDLWVDAVGSDADGSPVLVLTEDGPADPLFLRATEAVLEFRALGPLLARLVGGGALDANEPPTLVLIARRFSEGVLGRLGLLRLPTIRCLEAVLVDGVNGSRLLVTARSELRADPPAVRRVTTPDRLDLRDAAQDGVDGEGRGAGATPSANDVGRPESTSVAGPGHATNPRGLGSGRSASADDFGRGGVRGLDSPTGVPFQASSPHTRNGDVIGPRGAIARGEAAPLAPPRRKKSLLDEIKQRVLRMSPDVFEEGDGEVVRFHVGAHRLCTLVPRGRSVWVRAGDAAGEVQVDDEPSLQVAVDAVFERFFQLVDARRGFAVNGHQDSRGALEDAREDGREHDQTGGGAAAGDRVHPAPNGEVA